mmetsp:Transcript_7872/g.15226  ORF Transcript_7872/g.15226 Transcript_7872/m.15226 type:complete len:751 (+) Transcript_7872:4659-6911(+)
MEDKLLTPLADRAEVSTASVMDSEREQQLEIEIYKTEQELDGLFTTSTLPTPIASASNFHETCLKREYDKLVAENAEKERKLAQLNLKYPQLPAQETPKEISFKSYYEEELAKLQTRHDNENYQTLQLNSLIRRDQATIVQLRDQINQLTETNRRLKAPYQKSEKAKLVAVNSMTTLLNDKVHFAAEAAERRKVFYTLKDRQEEVRLRTAEEAKLSIERISRYNLKSKAKHEATARLKELLSCGLNELSSTKQLNNTLTNKISTYYREIGKIRKIIEMNGCTMTTDPGMTVEETDTVISYFKQMADKELSLKYQFACLATEAEKRRVDCMNIREELNQLKVANKTLGPSKALPQSANLLSHTLEDRQSLDSKETHIVSLESSIIRVLFCLLELMEKVYLAMKIIKEHSKLPEETIDILNSFKNSMYLFRRGLKSPEKANIPTRRRSQSYAVNHRSRESTFKTEVDLIQTVPSSPLPIPKVKNMIMRMHPGLETQIDAMLTSLKISKVFIHFLDESKILEILDQGFSIQDFPIEGLKKAHEVYRQFLQTVIKTYAEFHKMMAGKCNLLKLSVEKSVMKNFPKLKIEDGVGLALSSSMPILKSLTTVQLTKTQTQRSTSRLHKQTTCSEENAEIEKNSFEDKLGILQRQIKQEAMSQLPKKIVKTQKKSLVKVPMTASSSRLSSFSVKLLREMRSYDSKLADINLCQKRLCTSPTSDYKPFYSPRPKFMSIAGIMDRKYHSRQSSMSRPSLQ